MTNKVPSFLQKFDKSVSKMGDVATSLKAPDFYFDTGSVIINKIISDSYNGGYAQGRLSLLAGEAGAGKSFLAGNAIAAALREGYGAFAIDSENALDEVYLKKIGVDVESPLYSYNGVKTIETAMKVFTEFCKLYESAPEDEKIPYLIVIDSLDDLKPATKDEKNQKGEFATDMGAEAKLKKQFLLHLSHNIRDKPFHVICTKQPYQNQDVFKKHAEPLVITSALKFAFDQILMLNAKRLKGKSKGEIEGIVLEVTGVKTRFAKPFQKCLVEVPYETGIDRLSGVLEAAISMGIVKKPKGSGWHTYGENKFQATNADEYIEDIYADLLAREGEKLIYEDDEDDDEGD